MEAVSDGGLSEELEDVSEDEEFRVFQVSFPYLIQGLDCTQNIARGTPDPSSYNTCGERNDWSYLHIFLAWPPPDTAQPSLIWSPSCTEW